MGTVFNIQRHSVYDGPGIRTIVFLKGCPLRCLWCHNPEGLDKDAVLMFNPSRCIACGDCVKECEHGRHLMTDGYHTVINKECARCGHCVDACVGGALSLAGKEMSVDEVMQIVMRDEAFYKQSGGGITLSGGEPLFQADFAIELNREAKKRGITTCVETSGFGSWDKLEQLAKYTDRFLFDYKATGEELHKKLCGVSQKCILDNLQRLDALGKEIVLRCPIIPGLNDTEQHIEGIAEIAKKYSCILEVQLEPYHQLGVSKATQMGISDYFDGPIPERNVMESYVSTIEALSGKKTSIS